MFSPYFHGFSPGASLFSLSKEMQLTSCAAQAPMSHNSKHDRFSSSWMLVKPQFTFSIKGWHVWCKMNLSNKQRLKGLTHTHSHTNTSSPWYWFELTILWRRLEESLYKYCGPVVCLNVEYLVTAIHHIRNTLILPCYDESTISPVWRWFPLHQNYCKHNTETVRVEKILCNTRHVPV